jgi:hypothetical protein
MLVALERLADSVERLSIDYAVVHNLRLTECPECHARPVPPLGRVFHVSGCTALWEPNKLHIPGEGL